MYLLPSQVVHIHSPFVLSSVFSSWMILCRCKFPLWYGRARQSMVSLQGTGQLEGVVSVLRLKGTGLSHSTLLHLLNLGGVDKHYQGIGHCGCLKPEVGGGILAFNIHTERVPTPVTVRGMMLPTMSDHQPYMQRIASGMKPAAKDIYCRYGRNSHVSRGRASQVSDPCANNSMWG